MTVASSHQEWLKWLIKIYVFWATLGLIAHRFWQEQKKKNTDGVGRSFVDFFVPAPILHGQNPESLYKNAYYPGYLPSSTTLLVSSSLQTNPTTPGKLAHRNKAGSTTNFVSVLEFHMSHSKNKGHSEMLSGLS